jgi:hypothetical protein
MFGKDVSRLSSRTIWCSNTDQTGASILKIMETTRHKRTCSRRMCGAWTCSWTMLARRSYDALHSSPPLTVVWSAATTPELSEAK